MKNKITEKKSIGNREWLIAVELNPESEYEKEAIRRAQFGEATEEERQMIDSHLLMSLGNSYSIIDFIKQDKNTFIVKAFLN